MVKAPVVKGPLTRVSGSCATQRWDGGVWWQIGGMVVVAADPTKMPAREQLCACTV